LIDAGSSTIIEGASFSVAGLQAEKQQVENKNKLRIFLNETIMIPVQISD
jgi:hypothetical protein